MEGGDGPIELTLVQQPTIEVMSSMFLDMFRKVVRAYLPSRTVKVHNKLEPTLGDCLNAFFLHLELADDDALSDLLAVHDEDLSHERIARRSLRPLAQPSGMVGFMIHVKIVA